MCEEDETIGSSQIRNQSMSAMDRTKRRVLYHRYRAHTDFSNDPSSFSPLRLAFVCDDLASQWGYVSYISYIFRIRRIMNYIPSLFPIFLEKPKNISEKIRFLQKKVGFALYTYCK